MARKVNFEREIDLGLGSDEVKIEKIGENSYKVVTGSPDKHGFSRSGDRRRAFDRNFIDEFNQVADHDDRFRRSPSSAGRSMKSLRSGLEGGESSISFKVKD